MRMLEYRYIGDKMILEFNPQCLKKITLYSSLAKMCADSTLIDLINIFPNRELYSVRGTKLSEIHCCKYPAMPPIPLLDSASRQD